MNAEMMLGFLAEVAVKSTPVLATALLIVRFRRRSAAAFRHAITAAGVLVALALPLVTATLPQWRLAVLPAGPGSGSKLRPLGPLLLEIAGGRSGIRPTSASIAPQLPASSGATSDASIAPLAPAEPAVKWTWCDGVLLIWLCGALATLGVCLAGHLGAMALARSAPLARGDDLRRQFRPLVRRMGIRRSVRFRVGGRVGAPMAMGVFRPTVLLPAETRDWPRSAIRAAVMHELAHVQRFDPALQLLGWLACAVYWFNPLVWLAAARMRIDRELACDDAVLRRDVEPAGYARLLVDVARSVQSRWAPALPMARPSSLKYRIYTILDESADRRPTQVGGRVVIGASIALILLAVAPLKLGTRTARAAEPAPADSTDAAELYLGAAKILRDNDSKNIMCPAASTLVYPEYPPYSKEWTAMESADYPANAEARAMAHRARSIDKIVWPEEKLPNGDVNLKHLNEMRNLANELGDAAVWEHLQGDDGHAIETIRDLLHLSMLVRQSRTGEVVSRLVSIGIEAMALDRLNVIVPTAQWTSNPKEAKKLSVTAAKLLLDELAVDILDPAQFEREARADAAQEKLSPKDLDRLVNNVARVAAEMDMTRLILACHLYRHDHATWPASLDDLHAYVPQVPIDPLGDGKQTIGYVVIKRGLPDGSDRPLVYSRYGSTAPLFYRSAQPGYSLYRNVDAATGKQVEYKVGGQFRDVAGWSPADRDHAPPTTRPVP